MKRFILVAGAVLAGAAHAGHEFPFYPSFYPQEITLEALDAPSAARRLAEGTLHAYAGAGLPDSEKTGVVTSLSGYVVARGCVDALTMQAALPAGGVWHPYPVTPFHADYLYHADRADAAIKAQKNFSGKVEVVDLDTLMNGAGAWSRQGWFHAYRLLAPAKPDARIEGVARRLMRAQYRGLEERIRLERDLVALLQRRCERTVLGYTVRRERYSADYSQGVENVGYDALAGLASAIFPRTVKLRDFPWNGWLNVAVEKPPSSAWNPLAGGFGDPFGRMLWSALADPAFLPAPHGGGWIENRVHASVRKGDNPRAVRVVYKVHNSAFHDGTPMNFADVLYAYGLAHPERLHGMRLLRVETETLAFGEDKLTYEVPVIEVLLDGVARHDAATVAPPWTTLPWHLLALFEEAARRGDLKLSDFDAVRDAALVRRLGELARELEERSYVPPQLKTHVNAQEARARYGRLREFHAAHGHWLVTNGPYLLDRWDGKKAVLGVFRDPSYPNGLGTFNRYAVPLKAYVTRVERRGTAAQVHIETERLEREGRDVRIVRGAPDEKRPPICRYLLVGRDGTVAAAGEVRAGSTGVCELRLPRSAQGISRLILAATLEGAAANAPIRIVPWE